MHKSFSLTYNLIFNKNLNSYLMSYYSNAVFLKNQVSVVSTPTVSSNIISANQYSVSVSFNPPSSENGILHYRLYFIEAKDSTSFKLDNANAVSSSNYQVTSPTGTIQTLSFNSINLLTVNGSTLEPFKKYKVKIMAYTDSVNSNFSSLSGSSNSFTVFTQTEAVKSIIVEDIDDNHTVSDIRVSFNKVNNESQILEYRLIFVPKNDKLFFNIDSANITTHYVSVVPNGNNQSLVLPLSTLDYHGSSILESNTYYAYVLSKCNLVTSDANQLSPVSKYFAYNTPNHFVAGQTQGLDVFYYDIPDTTIVGLNTTANYFLDVDSNGVNDVKITCSHMGSQSGGSISFYAAALNNNKVNCTPDTNNIVPHDSLDMIYNDLSWKTTPAYLSYSSYQNIPPPGSSSGGGLWPGYLPKYLALKLLGEDTTFAWIKMAILPGVKIRIYSYGLLKKKNDVGGKELNADNIKLWPNPSSEKLYISKTINEIYIYNNTGNLVMKKYKTNSIDVSQLIPGIYIVILQNNDVYYRRKIVIN